MQASLDNDLEVPHIYFFDGCANFIRTVRTLQRDEKNADDIESVDSEDHLADAVRYALLDLANPSELKHYNI